MKIPKSKYTIWDDNLQVPAYTRRPKDPRAEELVFTNAQEREFGIKWYIPAKALRKGERKK